MNVKEIVAQVSDQKTKPKTTDKVYKLSEQHLTELFTLADKLAKKRPRAKREWTEEERAVNKLKMDALREKRLYRVRQRELDAGKIDLVIS